MTFKQNNIFAAAALLVVGVIGLAAFQSPTQKFGVVNLADLADKSKLGSREKKAFDDMRNQLGSLLQFMNNNKVMKREELNKLQELWLMEKPTADQTKQLETLKTSIQKNSDELRRLISILNPSSDEQAKIRELSTLAQGTEDILPQLDSRFTQMMQAKAQQKQTEVIAKSKAAVDKVGKRDGYTLVFESGVVPYGANDITDAALKIMDTDNP
jgi:Skp family chaperone for outer membrane proteins